MAFTFAAACYLFAMMATVFLIFVAIYTVVCLDELKTEYKNPIDQCRRMNSWLVPEYIVHTILVVMFVASWQLGTLVFNLPLFVWHVHRYATRPVMRDAGVYDATAIMNLNIMRKAQHEGWCKMAFYLISFFYYLYSMIYTLVTA